MSETIENNWLVKHWKASYDKKDLEKFLQCYDQNAHFKPTLQEYSQGMDHIEGYFKPEFEKRAKQIVTIYNMAIESLDNKTTIYTGKYSFDFTIAATGQEVLRPGQFQFIVQEFDNGHRRIQITNLNPPNRSKTKPAVALRHKVMTHRLYLL